MTATHKNKRVLMLCTAARGGMRAVVEAYARDGLFERWNVLLIATHVEGSLARRLGAIVLAMTRFLFLNLSGQVLFAHIHAAAGGSFWRKSIFGLVARLFGHSVIFHLHSGHISGHIDRLPLVGQRIAGWVLSKFSCVVVLSEVWRTFVLRIAPSAKVAVIPNYVLLPTTAPVTRPLREGRALNLLFLGFVGSNKGVFELIPAIARARSTGIDVRLTIAGHGEVEKAKRMAMDLDVAEAVSVIGWIDGERKLELLRSADVYVLPSRNEGMPVSILEAMSWSIPVVASRVGGIPEMIDSGVEGLLVEPGDIDGILDAILRLAADRELLPRMGRAARKRVESEFSKDVVLPKMEAIYEKFSRT
ncbi:glycosyltransferase family 4 protein [Methylibium sp. Root1272]|jgi:glycosyltransferase involved in cell wall biosynthesis|uniref:glycosyltransferase family 4 protein n=1 Tax=Methylibium sp. Root1272 TaxID=1736441 RepID=UPI000701ECA8|nr:glycosyltransferase family 4 protein [Methylibium sp. Root1272]KQW74139.1 hypothetical protein ASC67_18425 [Methylibium sp. Root1272]